MKKIYLSLLLLCNASLYAPNIQYTITSMADVPTTSVSISFRTNPFHSKTSYKKIINENTRPGGIRPGEVYSWHAQNTQQYCRSSIGDFIDTNCVNIDAYVDSISVEFQGRQSISTPIKETYDERMYFVIQPDGTVLRVYQIYTEPNVYGTIVPFKNNNPEEGPDHTKEYKYQFKTTESPA